MSGPVPSTSIPGIDGAAPSALPLGGSDSLASRRQRGPSLPIRISSNSSHAAVADCGRAVGSLAVRRSIHAEMSGSTSATSLAGGSGSLMCRSRIASGSSASWNGGLPVNSS